MSSISGHPLDQLLERGCRHRVSILIALATVVVSVLAAGRSAAAMPGRTADVPSAPCVFYGSTSSCESTNPNVTLEVVNERETSLCTFEESWTWGDGSAPAEATLRGSVEGSTQLLGSHTYPRPGTYAIRVSGYVVSEESGLEYTCEAPPVEYTFTLLASGAAAPTTSQMQMQTSAPTITSFTQLHRIWRQGTKLASISRARYVPLGTIFSFTLNEQATVTFSFAQRASKAGRCSPKNHAHKTTCSRGSRLGTFSFTGHPGVGKVRFQGRISAANKLAPGNYTLTIFATDTAQRKSAARSLSFTIVD